MGRDLDDICVDIARRASPATKDIRDALSDEELERYLQALAEDVRVALMVVSVEEIALRTGITKETLLSIAADAPRDQRLK
jgi:hypothetical protein